jgi:[ribosomal protein S18]-alanine N-acetyltransferase
MFNIQRLDSTHISRCLEILQSNFDIPWKELHTVFKQQISRVYGVFMGDLLIGFLAMSTILDESEILMCAVDPGHHKKGLASALVDHALNDLSDLRINTVFLEVDIHNLAAIGLYKKFGFQSVGQRKGYYLQSNGSYNDAIIMRLDV